MGINSINAIGGSSGMQKATNQIVDTESKSIQDKIENVQRQKKALSSQGDMSVEEKAKKRQELQQELGSLNTQLRQHQADLRKEKYKETMKDELKSQDTAQTDSTQQTKEKDDKIKLQAADVKDMNADLADTKKSTGREDTAKDINAQDQQKDSADKNKQDSEKQLQGVASARTDIEQSRLQGKVVSRIEGGIAVLKNEIKQDELRGEDTTQKQKELKKQEDKAQWAIETPFSELGNAGSAADNTAAANGGILFNDNSGDNAIKIIFKDTGFV